MIVETGAGKYKCTSAEQHLDGVHLLDADGSILLIIENPEDIRAVEGGEILVIKKPTTQEERIAELEEAMELLLSGVTE